MLGNNEKIPNINTAELFAAMVSELPWRKLGEYINANSQLQKLCTLGGHRLDPNQRQRLEKIILKEAENNGYSEVICNGLFAVWYPVHAEIHSNLEGYFRSDEYKDYRSANNLAEDEYVLSDDKFKEYFKVNEIKAWTILLAFSPLKFTAEQADSILNSTAGSAELVEKVKQLEAQLAEAVRKNEQAAANADKLRQQSESAASEVQEMKKQMRQMKAELDGANQKLVSAAAENRRLSSLLNNTNSDVEKREKEVAEAAERNASRLQAETARMQAELNNWQNKYQEQLLANRQIVANSQNVEKRAAEADAQRDAAALKLEESRKFVDLLLGRIDWARIGAQLKLSPTLRRNFNSLIKKLNYESDLSLTIEGTLPQFWSRLSQGEAALIEKIANSNTAEVERGDMQAFWNEVEDSFAEVQSSIEARLFMIGFLHEVLFSIYMPEQLETPSIPAQKKK